MNDRIKAKLYHKPSGNLTDCIRINMIAVRSLLPEFEIESWKQLHKSPKLMKALACRFEAYMKAKGNVDTTQGRDERPAYRDKITGKIHKYRSETPPAIDNLPTTKALKAALRVPV